MRRHPRENVAERKSEDREPAHDADANQADQHQVAVAHPEADDGECGQQDHGGPCRQSVEAVDHVDPVRHDRHCKGGNRERDGGNRHEVIDKSHLHAVSDVAGQETEGQPGEHRDHETGRGRGPFW